MPLYKTQTINTTKTILFVLLCAIANRLMFLYHPFWGLEYEDSYIFSTVSRAININYDFSYDALYTKYETFGSFVSGSATSTISGHFIFFPLILSVFNWIIGFHAKNVLLVNFLFSIVSIYYALKTYSLLNPNAKSLLGFGLVFSTVPFLSVYNTSGLSETFSSVFVIISVYYAFKSKKENYSKLSSIIGYCLLICISIFIKRDNLVLLIIPIFEVTSAFYLKKDKAIKTRLFFIISLILLCVLILNNVFDINRTLNDEMNDIQESPFSFQFLKVLFPLFIKSLLKIKFFSIVGLMFFSSLIFYRKINSYLFLLLSICLGYLLVYSIHYRSYYMVHGDFVPNTIDTFRYFTNFFSVLSIFCFALLSIGLKKTIENQTTLFSLIISITVIVNVYYTIFLREDLGNNEFEERFQPVTNTLQIIKEDDIIITDRPILFQLLGPDKLFIIDISMIGKSETKKIDSLMKSKNIYLMKDEENDDRYENKITFLNNHKFDFVKKLSGHYNLLKLH